jgi:hypothetical protein
MERCGSKKAMTKKSISGHRNPVTSYLESNEDNDGLAYIARRFAEPFDAGSFRVGLVAKLKRFKYQPAKLKGNEKTFHQILTEVGVLDLLLRDETLFELWQCTLLKKIVQRAREFDENDQAADGQPLRDIRKKERQVYKDMLAIEEIADRNNSRKESVALHERLERKYIRLAILLLISTKYKGSRAELLSGRTEETFSKGPRDEDVATKRAIFHVLKERLQTKKTKKKGLFDILLCQVAELVWASSDAAVLSNGQSLYRDLKRST